jgi:hypothetical protein
LIGGSIEEGKEVSKGQEEPSSDIKREGTNSYHNFRKYMKKKGSHINLVLGEDLKLHEVVSMMELVVVG